MDMMTKQDLTTLLGSSGWCVSLYIPAHRAGRETDQDPIRFKNLLREAEERLQSRGLRTPDVQDLLGPAKRLLQDTGFWRHQSDGLAVFASPGMFRCYRLPIKFEELAIVSDRFHLKPLLPFMTGNSHFYILALSQNQVRLLEGTRHTVDEIELEGISGNLAEAVQHDGFERQMQFHTHTPSNTGARAAVFHGHDAGDDAKDRILSWFRQIDHSLKKALKNPQSPLVLAGVDYLMSLYSEANSHQYLVNEGIQGNPEDLSPRELHAQAWTIVQPHVLRVQERAVAQYRQLAGTGRTTTDIEQAVLAAHHGRVELLFVAVGVQVWGRVELPATVSVHPEPMPGDSDLLDVAAIQSLITGGTVYAVAPEQVPDRASVAAVFRY